MNEKLYALANSLRFVANAMAMADSDAVKNSLIESAKTIIKELADLVKN